MFKWMRHKAGLYTRAEILEQEAEAARIAKLKAKEEAIRKNKAWDMEKDFPWLYKVLNDTKPLEWQNKINADPSLEGIEEPAERTVWAFQGFPGANIFNVSYEKRDPDPTNLVKRTTEYLDTFKDKREQAKIWWTDNHPMNTTIRGFHLKYAVEAYDNGDIKKAQALLDLFNATKVNGELCPQLSMDQFILDLQSGKLEQLRDELKKNSKH